MLSRLMGKKDLYKASLYGDLQSVRAALASGQSANSRGGRDGDFPCLIVAVSRGYNEVVTELLQQEDCDPCLENNKQDTALHLACRMGRVGMVRQLASHPRQSSLNSKNQYGCTAIMYAVWRGHAECVLALGRVAGVELDTRDWEGMSLEEMAR